MKTNDLLPSGNDLRASRSVSRENVSTPSNGYLEMDTSELTNNSQVQTEANVNTKPLASVDHPEHHNNGIYDNSNQVGGPRGDSTESEKSDNEHENKNTSIELPTCSEPHDWRQFLDQHVPCSVDQLFAMLFTTSKFNDDLQTIRLVRNYVENPWQDQEDGGKTRLVTYIQCLTQAIGPKELYVNITQMLHKCSKAGMLYSVSTSAQNRGVPYADCCTIELHYCMKAVDAHSCHIAMYGMVKYKKNVWSMVKSVMEKNTYEALAEYGKLLASRFHSEIGTGVHVQESKKRNKKIDRPERRAQTIQKSCTSAKASPVPLAAGPTFTPPTSAQQSQNSNLSWPFCVFALILLVNVALYWRLGNAGISQTNHLDSKIGMLTKSQIAEWSHMLEQHTSQQRGQLQTWREAIDRTVIHLAQTEQALMHLMETMKPSIDKAQRKAAEQHQEL